MEGNVAFAAFASEGTDILRVLRILVVDPFGVLEAVIANGTEKINGKVALLVLANQMLLVERYAAFFEARRAVFVDKPIIR